MKNDDKRSLKPIFKFDIGAGDKGVLMGVYTYSIRDDNDSDHILGYGYTICPVRSAIDNLAGLYDPEQNERIGMSQNRASAVAIAGGSGEPDRLTDKQRETARTFLNSLMNEKFSEDVRGLLDIARTSPAQTLITDWDKKQSTAIYLDRYEEDITTDNIQKKITAQSKRIIRDITAAALDFNPPGSYKSGSLKPARSGSLLTKSRNTTQDNVPPKDDVLIGLFDILSKLKTQKNITEKAAGKIHSAVKESYGDEVRIDKQKIMAALLSCMENIGLTDETKQEITRGISNLFDNYKPPESRVR